MEDKHIDGMHSGANTCKENWTPPVHVIPDPFERKCKKCRSLVNSSGIRTSGIIMALVNGTHYGTRYTQGNNFTCSRIENQVRTLLGGIIDRPVKLNNSCGLFEISKFYSPEIQGGE